MDDNTYKTIKAALDYSMTPDGLPIKEINYRWEQLNYGENIKMYKPRLSIEFIQPKIIEVKPNKE